MKKKIYLHYEPHNHPESCYTKVYLVDVRNVKSIEEMVENFFKKVSQRQIELTGSNYALVNENGREVSLTYFHEEVEDAQDFFLCLLPGQKAEVKSSSGATSHCPGTTTTTPASSAGTASASGITTSAPLAKASSSTAPTTVTTDGLPSESDLMQVENYVKNKAYKKARQLLDQWLPQQSGKSNINAMASVNKDSQQQPVVLNKELQCLVIRMKIDLYAGRYDQVIRNGQLAIKKYRGQAIAFYQLLAQAYNAKEDYDEAAQSMDEALTLWSSSPQARKVLPAQERSDDHYFDLVAEYANYLFDAGAHGEAANKVNEVMSLPKAESHLGLLTAYGRFALQYNKINDACNAIMKVIAAMATKPLKDQPEKSRKFLADFFATPGAIESFQSKLPNGRGAAEIFAYLGSSIKDFSRFEPAIRLYHLALSNEDRAGGQKASYVLNLAHVLEMAGRLEQALQEIQAFWGTQPTYTVGGVSNKSLLQASKGEDGSEPLTLQWVVTGSKGEGYAIVASSSLEEQQGEKKVNYTPSELDWLAVGALAVKLLFLLNKQDYLPSLIVLLEGVRRKSQVALHETNLRNEMAYYTHVVRMICFYDGVRDDPSLHVYFSEERRSKSTGVIYVCGDSHCLSPAYATLALSRSSRVVTLVPKLVTGVKIWHLRDGCTFHPKSCFFQSLYALPQGSEVILILGEIDCREGLLVAVEKDIYVDLEDAVKNLVQRYLVVLKNLRKKKQFKVIWYSSLEVNNSSHYDVCVDCISYGFMLWHQCFPRLVQSSCCSTITYTRL